MANERMKAAEAGAVHYSTGRPCSKGHVSLRYVSTGGCMECAKAASYQYNKIARGKARRPLPALTLRVHPDDWEAVYALADYLNQQRGLMPTPRLSAAPPAPPVDTRTQWERIYEFRFRTHGDHEMARTLTTREVGPEEHSPGWSWPSAPVAPAVPAPAAHGGGAKPDWL